MKGTQRQDELYTLKCDALYLSLRTPRVGVTFIYDNLLSMEDFLVLAHRRKWVALLALTCTSGLLVGCAGHSEPESSLSPSTTGSSRASEAATTESPWDLPLAEGDHFLGRISSDEPSITSLSMAGVEGNRFVTYAYCEGTGSLTISATGTGKDAEDYERSVPCNAVPSRETLVFDPKLVNYEELKVDVGETARWAVSLAWQGAPENESN